MKKNCPTRTTVALAVGTIAACAGIQPAFAQGADADAHCASLANVFLPDTRVTLAQAIRPNPTYAVPGTDRPQRGPVTVSAPFCRVAGTVAPAVQFEVWMPLANWNGRFVGLGIGGFSGAIAYADLAQWVEKGYAVGSTDNGHQGSDPRFALKPDGTFNEQTVGDWAFRAMNEMTVKSKQVVAAFYGKGAHHSYFTGCSSGGHQALTQAQRFPDNYDGILAGATANFWTNLMAGQLAYGQATRVDPATDLEKPVNKLPAIHDAVVAACDAKDGVKDGVLESPLQCDFKPASLLCKGADSASCLTQPQVTALEKIYADAKTAAGKKIFPGLAPGGEMGWPSMSAGQVPFAENFYRYLVFQQPEWSFKTMDMERDVAEAQRRIGHIVNSTNPDLSRFHAHGGKLIQYHGWNDPLISPYNSIDYYETVIAAKGAKARDAALRQTQADHRLFMIPGMLHCRGGDATDTFEGVKALEAWVEQGVAPERIEATKVVDGKVARSRPLCPYPQVATYKGKGNTDDAANFTCAVPKH
jgi:feruloyl esterase